MINYGRPQHFFSFLPLPQGHGSLGLNLYEGNPLSLSAAQAMTFAGGR
jgi:hypothetical protein